ncbi:MAG TPA: exosortase system-associated protein, TIGR04073 family [Candidatus Binatia bacterium]|nr:exosortase system-associated protein, TIGR04073 family [Candidatus Binatia bacterium]
MRAVIAVGIVASCLALAPVASATRYEPENERYTALDKLGRGLAAMTTGFLELPGNIVAENRDHGATAAATIGVAKGIGMIPVRELVGVYDFVTSPIPLPDDYEPLIHPEYPWDYFDGAAAATPNRQASFDVDDDD